MSNHEYNIYSGDRTNKLALSLIKISSDWVGAFEIVLLRPGQIIVPGGAQTSALHFPIDSVIADLMSPTCWSDVVEAEKSIKDDSVLVGIYGREDVVGLQSLLSNRISSCQSVVEFGGYTLRCQVNVARRIIQSDPGSRELLDDYAALVWEELGQQSAAERRLSVADQVAAYLLRLSQAREELAVPITHAHISKRLGARRPSVTESLKALVELGVIKQVDRGRIELSAPSELRKIVEGAWPAMHHSRELFRLSLGK